MFSTREFLHKKSNDKYSVKYSETASDSIDPDKVTEYYGILVKFEKIKVKTISENFVYSQILVFYFDDGRKIQSYGFLEKEVKLNIKTAISKDGLNRFVAIAQDENLF